MVISKELIRYAMSNLEHRASRSIITIGSIFLGITTIFIFISFGLGLYAYVESFSSGSSVDKISIMPRSSGAPGLDDAFSLTESDLDAILRTPGVFDATALYNKAAEVTQDKKKIYIMLIGYDLKKPIIFELANIDLYKGRNLRSGDKGKVVLGYNYLFKDKIFPKAYDLNDKIEIQGREYRIVGFYEPAGNPQDDSQIYMSDNDMKELYGSSLKGYSWAMAEVDVDKIDIIVERIENNLRKSRNVDKGKEDFFVQSWQDLIDTYSSVLNGIVAFIILIAMISVLVSAINTANTMITSVLERTREIGVMKAVGAKNSEIFKLFLLESSILGFIAGVIGVSVGYILTEIAANFLASTGWSLLQPQYSFMLFFNLILFATLTGALSGAIPAFQASRVNPVKALRYE